MKSAHIADPAFIVTLKILLVQYSIDIYVQYNSKYNKPLCSLS